MAETTKIEWTDATWNPVTGCSVVSPGCTNCYAMGLAGTRLKHHPSRAGLTTDSKAGPVWNGKVRLNEAWLTQPLQWKRPRRIFVCAHGDLFAEGVPDEWIDRVFAVMALAPQHTFQVLTKRAARMRAYMAAPDRKRIIAASVMDVSMLRMRETGSHEGGIKLDHFSDCFKGDGPFPNVWLGVSTEDQRRADERVPDLLATPAAVRFVSAEPLLGKIVFPGAWLRQGDNGSWPFDVQPHTGIDWIIAGGESGPSARPMHPHWVRLIRDQCAAAGIPFFFKQWGAWASVLDRDAQDPDWRANYSHTLNDSRPDIAWLNLAGGRGFHGEQFHVMRRVGKRAAGRLLDGAEHNGMPSHGGL